MQSKSLRAATGMVHHLLTKTGAEWRPFSFLAMLKR